MADAKLKTLPRGAEHCRSKILLYLRILPENAGNSTELLLHEQMHHDWYARRSDRPDRKLNFDYFPPFFEEHRQKFAIFVRFVLKLIKFGRNFTFYPEDAAKT